MRSALGIFGAVAGAVVVLLVGRYGYMTSDTAVDGAIASFFFAAIAIGGIAGPAAAVHLFRSARGWAKLWGALALGLALVALAVNLTNSLGAIAGRADKTLAERARAADDRKDDRARLARVERERGALVFTATDAAAVKAAQAATQAAERTRKAECPDGDLKQRGPNCRIRETEEAAAKKAEAAALANKALTDQAAKLDAEAVSIRARLDKAPQVSIVNPSADTLGRILSLPADTATTAQQVAMVVTVELLIAFSLIAFELLAPWCRKEQPAEIKASQQTTAAADASDSGKRHAKRALSIAGVKLVPPPKSAPPASVDVVGRFMLACLRRAPGKEVAGGAIYARHQRWCSEQQPPLPPLDPRSFAEQFAERCDRVGLRARRESSKVYCVDVQLVA